MKHGVRCVQRIPKRKDTKMKVKTLLLCSAFLAVLAAPAARAADDEGAKIVAEVCSKCHTPTVRPIDKMHNTRQEWADAIERMQGYGADIPKAKIPALLDYLTRNYGPEKK